MNSWRTTINCSRFAIGVSYCHLCTISLGKIIYGFFTLILLYLSNLCASGFEAHINSPIKNRNSDILFQMFFFCWMFLLLDISFHFLWMEFSVAFLCSASSIHLICLHDAFFRSRVNFVGMSEVDFKKISYLLASDTANVYNWIFVFRFPLCWFIVCSILIRVIFASLFVGSQSSHFFFIYHSFYSISHKLIELQQFIEAKINRLPSINY